MIRVGIFDTKPYDKTWFDDLAQTDIDLTYFEHRLDCDTARAVQGLDAVCPFVSDDLSRCALETLKAGGVQLVALRCAGYNNVDLTAAGELGIGVCRVPGYSPSAVAEHAAALLLTLNRHIHRAYNRTREHNFSLTGLEGFTLHGKKCGIIGTGRIGRAFCDIARGFGMEVLGYDKYPSPDLDGRYVGLDELLSESDVISLHCPLTDESRHLIDARALSLMKSSAILVNTSRGGLVDSRALLEALQEGRLGGAALDVYEEEASLFFEDVSGAVLRDEVLSLLLSMPNVLITSHQGFFTGESLEAIAEATLKNIKNWFSGQPTNLVTSDLQ